MNNNDNYIIKTSNIFLPWKDKFIQQDTSHQANINSGVNLDTNWVESITEKIIKYIQQCKHIRHVDF